MRSYDPRVETAPTGLRERSKARRRREIELVALRLFTERGYEGTTLGDIAAVAEVAPRTVSLYFPSKSDLALAGSNERAARLTAAFHAGPDADFLVVLDRWLADETALMDPQVGLLTHAMFAANPQLRALSSAPITEAIRLAAASLFATIGLPRDDPMSSVVAAAMTGAVTEYLTSTAARGPSPALLAALHDLLSAMVDSARRR